MKEARQKRTTCFMITFIGNFRKSRPTVTKSRWCLHKGRGVTPKKHKETFGSDEYFLIFEMDGGLIKTVYLCQNLSYCTLKIGDFFFTVVKYIA